MDRSTSRRHFLLASGAAASASALTGRARAARRVDPGVVVVASDNGLAAVERAYELALAGTLPVDAAVAGVSLVEADPADQTVGLGGLPNEDGVVELDACVMCGPTYRAGAVASLRNIVHPSQVALTVMRRTDHVLLVGEGALRFARQHGFREQELLTEASRLRWLRWKESLSTQDDRLAPEQAEAGFGGVGASSGGGGGGGKRAKRETGTINLCVRNAAGDLGGCTTTSGLAWKIPGRVGDSPLIGAGLYVDNEVGAAGSTGRGEAVILSCGAHSVVELMRGGMHPKDACLEVLRRIATRTRQRHLLREDGRVDFNVNLYAVSKSGAFGAACLHGPERFAVATKDGVRHEDEAALYER
jgi:N4-(beta-N-acetylglucosaminyl)-L-asparaginase